MKATALYSLSSHTRWCLRWLSWLTFVTMLYIMHGQALAQSGPAGAIKHLQGMASIQSADGKLRFLEANDPVFVGDVISTTDKGYALITLQDDTQFVMRPSSSFALDQMVTQGGPPDLQMRLLQGGVRMVTGKIAKENPQAFKLFTDKAQIGVNGTTFDARLCAEDCRQEGVNPVVSVGGVGTAVGALPVVARLVQVTGRVTAAQPGQPARPLRVGSSLYEGDEVKTAADSVAVIGFRDESKVSLNPESTVRLTDFKFVPSSADNRMGLNLAKGGLRALTGLVGKQSADKFTVKTRTATVGIRGTGMDISCEGPCSEEQTPGGTPPAAKPATDPDQPDGLFTLTWLGGTFFSVGPLDIPLGRVGFIGVDGQPRLLERVPAFFARFAAPRPDQIDVNWEDLFASVASDGSPGLYVFVRNGDVFVMAFGKRIDLAPGEVGFISPDGTIERIAPVPGFLVTDPYPSPEQFSAQDAFILQLFGVTMGQPGQEVCRF